jgi:hypothetical protein
MGDVSAAFEHAAMRNALAAKAIHTLPLREGRNLRSRFREGADSEIPE